MIPTDTWRAVIETSCWHVVNWTDVARPLAAARRNGANRAKGAND
jgi:hypothetical protein